MGRLSLTEQDLWLTLRREWMTRIETGGTAEGVSDVEYNAPRAVGWVELKVCRVPRKDGPYVFGSALSVHRARWLLTHDRARDPRSRIQQYSYLVAGAYTTQGRFDHFIVARARPAAALFVQGRPRVPASHVHAHHGIMVLRSAELVVQTLWRGGADR